MLKKNERAAMNEGGKETRGQYWKEHPGEYQRRAVTQITTFCGWDTIENLAKSSKDEGKSETAELRELLVYAIFLGGWRVSEACHMTMKDGFMSGIKKENIVVHGDKMVFEGVSILKKFNRKDKYQVKTIKDGKPWYETHFRTVVRKDPAEMIRSAPVPMYERFTQRIVKYAKSLAEGEYLFPFSRQYVYKFITATDKEFYPHRLRAERATQLAIEYGWTTERLMRWFRWSSEKEAARYAGLSWHETADFFPRVQPKVLGTGLMRSTPSLPLPGPGTHNSLKTKNMPF